MHTLLISLAIIAVVLTLWACLSGVNRWLIVFYLPVMFAFLLSMFVSLGVPKPVESFFVTEDVTVHSYLLREHEAIYLWVTVPGSSEPVALVLPWSMEQARQLQEAGEMADGQGTELKMKRKSTNENEETVETFYAEPQPSYPDKPQ